MIVTVDGAGAVQVGDIDRLDRLKVVAAAQARLAEAFAGIGAVEGDHVWISQTWLAGHGPREDAAWRDGFRAMLDYAESKGWTRPDGTVRVHIEIG